MPGHREMTSHDLDCYIANERSKAVDRGLVECPACDGNRTVDDGFEPDAECAFCDGSGEVTPAEARRWHREREAD